MSSSGYAQSNLYVVGDKELLEKVASYLGKQEYLKWIDSWGPTPRGDKHVLYIDFTDSEMYSSFNRDMMWLVKTIKHKFDLDVEGFCLEDIDGDVLITEYREEDYEYVSVRDVASLGVSKLKQLLDERNRHD